MSKQNLETRQSGTPVGLDNIGNSCFMNSLLQCYFAIPPLVKQVLQAKSTSPDPHCLFLKSLQILFSQQIGSVKKSVNPKAVLDSLAKASNSGINRGTQEDVGEFHMIFVDNLGKALVKCVNSLDQEIKSLFVGVHSEFIYLKPGHIKQTKVEFCPLIIGNDEGDLVSAWEKSGFSSISGYRRESGNIVELSHENWITDLPGILFFQVKRSIYVEGVQEIFKDCSGVKIPEVLYPDKMMAQNREIVLKLRVEANELLEEKRLLNEKLKRIYSSSDKNKFDDSLKTVINFLSSEFGAEFDSNFLDGVKYLKTLELYVQQLVSHLTERINEIDEEISKKYDVINKTPYVLHSILVHEGIESFGHYFALIKDYNLDIWRKYNDSIVTLVPEEEVNKIVSGQSEGKSAYCILYINQQLTKSPTGLPFMTYELDLLNEGNPINEYSFYIQNIELTNYVNTENFNFYSSTGSIYSSNFSESNNLEMDRSQTTIQIFESEFESKLRSEGKMIGIMANQTFKEIQSFSKFLYHRGKYEFRRYAIMDFVCKTIAGRRLTELDSFIKDDLLRIVNNKSNVGHYEEELKNYSIHLRYIKLGQYIIGLVANNKINSATRIFSLIFVAQGALNETIYNLIIDLFKHVLFYLISDLLRTCREKNIEKIVENCGCIHLLYSLYKDLAMVHKLDKLIIKIQKEYAGGFKGENKNRFLLGIELAKSQNLDTNFAVEQVLADSAEFNEEFANIDLVTFEDNGEINQKIQSFKSKIFKIQEKFKKFTCRRINEKELDIIDFE